jgi:HD domain
MLGPSLILSGSAAAGAQFKFQTRSARTALRWLRNRSLGFSRVCIDPGSWDEDFLTLVYEARLHRPVTPIFILGNDDGLNSSDLQRLGVSGRLQSHELVFEPARENQPLSQSISLHDEGEYVGIPVADFLGLESLGLDLFLKSPAGKWVLLYSANEMGLGERVRTYWNRGLNVLYISKHAFQRQLDAIKMFGNLLPQSVTGSGILKTAQTLRSISRVLEGVRSLEQADQSAWDSVGNSIARLHRFWDSGPWANPDTILRNAPLLDHSLSVLVISLLVGRELGFESQESLVKLGLAAAFHDIGLLDLGCPVPSEERVPEADFTFTPAQRQTFLDHPATGAAWISQHFRGEQIVAQSVALHHWRRDDSGFYARGKQPVLEAPRMAEILGIAEMATFELLRTPFGAQAGWSNRLADKLANHFSTPVLEGLRGAFEPQITL